MEPRGDGDVTGAVRQLFPGVSFVSFLSAPSELLGTAKDAARSTAWFDASGAEGDEAIGVA